MDLVVSVKTILIWKILYRLKKRLKLGLWPQVWNSLLPCSLKPLHYNLYQDTERKSG